MLQKQNVLVDKILITPKEKEIFNSLLQFRQHAKLNTTFRVAGGWVRDKLMGKESHDIDIALDDMMGEPFVKMMSDYLKSQNEQVEGFGVTKYNPAESKHLQTACVRIKDQWIDFVNLRGEEYTQDSRIPKIVIGTPEQDAYRRDLTINSMFYNINEDKIEDFTNKGLEDLQNGIIRTPLPPLQTYLDDPLRILRTFRFATRFQFKIVDDIFQAINQDVRGALNQKVSRERVRIELEWMLNNDKCQDGLNLYQNNELWSIIFRLPQECSVKLEDQGKYHIKSYNLNKIVQDHKEILLKNCQQFSKLEDINFYINLASICLPYQNIKYKFNKKDMSGVHYIVTDLKFTNKQIQNITTICEWVNQFNDIKRNNFQQQMKLIVKFIKATGVFWEFVVFLDYCNEILLNSFDDFTKNQEFITNVYNHKIQQFDKVKPLIDGNEVSKLFQCKGQEIGIINQNLMIWQALNMDKSREDLLKVIHQDQEYFKKQ